MANLQKIGRSTVYNKIMTPEKLEQCNAENLQLMEDYLDYMASIDRSKTTMTQYKYNMQIFWCWNLEFNNNKFFVDLTKRELAKFQNHAINVWGWSPKRIRTVKATLSSLSNYIENILDDEYDGYRPIIRKIENPANVAVRGKSIFTEQELQRLLNHLVENKQYDRACLLSLAMNSGRRKAELARFKVEYFDVKNLICNDALYKTPEKMVTKGKGSRGKLLSVYTLATPFEPYLDLWMEERERLGIKSEWLFVKKKGRDYTNERIPVSTIDTWANSFSKFFNRPFYWHSMRHFFTTKLSEANFPESVIQEIVGWESADMVRLYTDTAAEDKFEKYFDKDGIKVVKQSTLEEI